MGELLKFGNDQLSSGGGGNDMEARVAKLESDVEHIRTDVSDIKVELRTFKTEHAKDFRMLVGLHITTLLGLLAVISGMAGVLVKLFS